MSTYDGVYDLGYLSLPLEVQQEIEAHAARRVPEPTPMALCEVCGESTDTPPECEACAQRDEAQAKRRGDR